MGINLTSKKFRCWRCKKKGVATDIIQELESCSFAEANSILSQFIDPYAGLHSTKTVRELSKKKETPLPKSCSKEFDETALNYLRERNFSPNKLIEKYDLYCNGYLGKYKFRIIIPVIINGLRVGFTSRDYTKKNPIRYRRCPLEECTMDPAEWLYNYDSIRPGENVILVEGPTDVWRMGDGAISTLSTEFTNKQINLLLEKEIDRVTILFDSERTAQDQADKFANNLSPFIKEVEVVQLPEGIEDPGKLTDSQATELKDFLKKNLQGV